MSWLGAGISFVINLFRGIGRRIKFIIYFIGWGFKKIIVNPLVDFLYNFLGNTAAIFLGYALIWVHQRFNKKVTWPGFDFFFNNGSILLITFSFLATIAYKTTREKKFNFLNVMTFAAIAVNSVVYTAYLSVVSLVGSYEGDDPFLHDYSLWMFWVSSGVLLFVLIRDQFRSIEPNEIRDYYQQLLEKNFNP